MKTPMLMAALALGLTTAQAAVVQVHVFDFEFSINPRTGPVVDPTISLGDTVRWVWDAGMEFTHDVQSVINSPETFDSGEPVIGRAPFEHTFTQTGTFWYYCTDHGADNGNGTASFMAGNITVVPEPTTWASVIGAGLLAGVIVRRALRSRKTA